MSDVLERPTILSPTVFSSSDVMQALEAACAGFGNQGKWARQHGLSPQYVNDVLHRRCEMTGVIANALGFAQRVNYYKMELTDA